MAIGKDFFRNLFKKEYEEEDEDLFTEYAIDLEEADSYSWNWDTLINDRHLLKLSDDVQREKYIRSLVEQVRDASDEMDRLSNEYNLVTATLKDMDELEALPSQEASELKSIAERLIELEEEKRKYRKTESLMTKSQLENFDRLADTLPKAYQNVKEAEDMRRKIKDDLKHLEDEKQGYIYRSHELKREIGNSKGMIIICLFAAIVCVVMLLVLQFGFDMDTAVGYMIVAAAVALATTIIYVKYLDAMKEHKRCINGINRLILLQNTVKIRYINNKNLLDYLYNKYDTTSGAQLKKMLDEYEEERSKRAQNEENERQLTEVTGKFQKMLKRYHLSDIYTWVHNPLAVTDHKEMVEVRHTYILRRQKLRAQMDHNKKLAKEGENEIRQLIAEYPRYSKEVMEMLNRYS